MVRLRLPHDSAKPDLHWGCGMRVRVSEHDHVHEPRQKRRDYATRTRRPVRANTTRRLIYLRITVLHIHKALVRARASTLSPAGIPWARRTESQDAAWRAHSGTHTHTHNAAQHALSCTLAHSLPTLHTASLTSHAYTRHRYWIGVLSWNCTMHTVPDGDASLNSSSRVQRTQRKMHDSPPCSTIAAHVATVWTLPNSPSSFLTLGWPSSSWLQEPELLQF